MPLLQEQEKRKAADVEIALGAEKAHVNNRVALKGAAGFKSNVGIAILGDFANTICNNKTRAA